MSDRILVVDDSAVMRRQVRSALVAAGYDVSEARDGADGLAALRRDRDIAFVCCDLNMPVMSGLEMLEVMRATGSKVPVSLLTTDAPTAAMASARRLQATWLLKPVDGQLLIQVVRRAIFEAKTTGPRLPL